MKIAEVCSTFPPYKGGMGNVAYHNAWSLVTLGHEVTVFTNRRKEKNNYTDEYPFAVKRLSPWFKYGNSGVLPQLFWQLWNYDVIHLHYPFFGGSEVIYFLEKIKDLKIVVTYHMDVVGQGAVVSKIFDWHTEHVMPHILDSADKVIVTSWDYARSSAIKERIVAHPDKFTAIPCGVNHLIFKPRFRDKSIVEKYELLDKNVILFVGGLDKAHYFKGINILIQAIKQLSSRDDFIVLVVGDGDLRPSYESLVDTLGLGNKIRFVGNVSDNVLPKIYSVADMFVLPSIDKSEAFGMVALEAMASAVPVIAADLPGVRSVIDKMKTGLLVKPGDVDNLAKMISFLLKNPRLAKTMGKAGREKVINNYTWEKIGYMLDNVIRSVGKK
ncbi:glycosyltransferase family 1 protein [Candidatus Parcubacteria bacterium]|nr:MAG: glycosyltransferase family 1 protein [Candidatus Parcubacteria bacterium]